MTNEPERLVTVWKGPRVGLTLGAELYHSYVAHVELRAAIDRVSAERPLGPRLRIV